MELEIIQPNKASRFSNRAENYARYRSAYPEAILPFLEKQFGLNINHRIADIGSGTGLFTELFLKKGYRVAAIEPNEDMRIIAEQRLGHYANFESHNNTAEETGLRNQSIDLITVAQAFHWMDANEIKKEFERIIKPGGHIVLAWNNRKTESEFMTQYELIRAEYGIHYNAGGKIDLPTIEQFLSPGTVCSESFENTEWLDFDKLKGQLLSSSYIPLPGHRSYDAMISSLVSLFVHYNVNGFVKMDYETKLYWGQ